MIWLCRRRFLGTLVYPKFSCPSSVRHKITIHSWDRWRLFSQALGVSTICTSDKYVTK